ncbi:MAG TPA: tRNA lysidine(34) synthetase TilS [Rhizomicrobium sp.]|nr:tRNA lysidine(34) synthetase TilS [Rhizomicrobium sp.]
MKAAPWPGAVAVSGGGDSLALMLLLAEWADAQKKSAPIVLTVDHGLRPGSAKDAKRVAQIAKELGLKAHVFAWKGAKPKADIEAAAREARYRLMGEWCSTHGIAALYIAHTIEDQAETFLLRLARGSGLDGLSGMQSIASFPVAGFDGLSLVRPLLNVSRGSLRNILKDAGLDWLEDPMNDDPRFARVKIRKHWPELEALGLTPARIADAANHLARARQALEKATAELLARACRFEADGAVLDGAALTAAPREIGLRALASVLGQISGQPYRPRFERLERLFEAISDGPGKGRTLHGCRIGPAAKQHAHFGVNSLTITREKPRPRRR